MSMQTACACHQRWDASLRSPYGCFAIQEMGGTAQGKEDQDACRSDALHWGPQSQGLGISWDLLSRLWGQGHSQPFLLQGQAQAL